MVQAGGRGKSGDQVELGQEEVDEELLVEVHNCQEPVAQGVVRAADLLQVPHFTLRNNCTNHSCPMHKRSASVFAKALLVVAPCSADTQLLHPNFHVFHNGQ